MYTPTPSYLTTAGYQEDRLTQERPEQKRDIQSTTTRLRQDLSVKSGSHSLPRNIHINRDQSLREGSTCRSSQSEGHIPRGLVSAPLGNRASSIAPPVSPGTPELEEVLLPPPEAFRDTNQEQDSQFLKEKTRSGRDSLLLPHAAPVTQEKKEAFLETMSQGTKEKVLEGVPRQPGLPLPLSSENLGSENLTIPLGDEKSPKFAPPTAPKSRKLPPNIILKTSRSNFPSDPQNRFSHRSQATSRDLTPEHASSASSGLQEQRRARREALEKLGLPQDQSHEPSLQRAKSGSFLRSRQSPTRAPTPAPAPVRAPGPAAAPAPVRVPGPAAAPAPVRTPAPVSQVPASSGPSAKAQGPPSTPIPIPKPTRVSSGDSLSPAQSSPGSRLALKEGSIPGLRQMNFKSNTLERSGVGLSSYLLAAKDNAPQTSTSLGKVPILEKISPNVLRNTRPRPASLGGGKDFANIQVGKLADLEQERNSQRFSYPGQSRDKLPRPPCVSVKITPKGIPDEHRREALKKLGLLKE
ncbi:specifically androgen-regulated gene protein [Gracilinanus agilis]|uniref:specifically androgen-regulated gene protein n=1 Tax=Gracilinanus agilis TaxID=191870 RepID=UPI001CFEB358|nr:specifically androgen-regulated gene protein [Gracilinanus agilis]